MTLYYLSVAIPRSLAFIPLYTFQAEAAPLVGCRVVVPLNKTEITGLIVDVQRELADNVDASKLKSIISVLDQQPLYDEQLLNLLRWGSQYYHNNLGEVLFTATPVALRKTRELPKQTHWQITETGKHTALDELKRSPKQQAMLQSFQQQQNLQAEQCKNLHGERWRSTLKQLLGKQLIEARQTSVFEQPNKPPANPNSFDRSITLSDEQQQCIDTINAWQQDTPSKPVLLHGITGSGKTEIYLRLIEPYLQNQQQALILIPEIGLTQQLIGRFQHHFPEQQVAVLNSSLAKMERLDSWIAAKTGQAEIVIGTRSAIFTPMKQLGIIIIDEEHDLSFKQQDGFRYHARDLAVKRAYDHNIPIVLGSATPSLESLHNTHIDKYHYITLKKRPGTRQSPTIYLQDTRGHSLEAGLSKPMIENIQQTLGQGKQGMIFLNRRGFAPALFCSSCGWHAHCPDCDANMTYHASTQQAICHHCGFQYEVKQYCPDCRKPSLSTQGQGTERLEMTLQNHFPDTNIIRIDRDTTSRKGELDAKLRQVRSGEPCLLVGTQMLAKGHDFPNITLVGILDIDQALFSIDYRASERLAQLIIQVAGRAGRGDEPGKVILQTSQPEHPHLTTLLSQGYLAFANALLSERKQWNFPPYSYQALLRAEAFTMQAAMSFLEQARSLLDHAGLSLLGPIAAPMERRAKWYRAQLLITSDQRKGLHAILNERLASLNKLSKNNHLRWSIDVDPSDLS